MEESKTSVIQIPENAVAEDQRTDIESESTSLQGTDEKPENALDENEDFKMTLNTTIRENLRGFMESLVLKSETENLNDTSKEESVNPEHEAELQISGDSSCNFNAPEVNDENVDKSEVKNSNQNDRDNKPGVSKDKNAIIEEIVIEKTYKPRNITEIIHGKHDIAENDNTEERLKDESVSEKNFESRVLSTDNEIVGSGDGCKIAETEHAKGNSQKDRREEAEKTKSSEGTVRNTNDTGNEGEVGYITIKNSGKAQVTLETADLSDIISKGEMAEHEGDDKLATRNELANISVGNDGSGYENTKDVFQGDNKFQSAAISNKISTPGKTGPEPNKELTLRTDYDITREENCVCGNEEPNRVFQDDDNTQNDQLESFCGDEYDRNKARTKFDTTSDNVYFGDNDRSAVSEIDRHIYRTKRESDMHKGTNGYDERTDRFEIRDIKHSVEISKMVADSKVVIVQKYSGDNTTSNVSEYRQDNIDNKSETINDCENTVIGLDRTELPEEKSFMTPVEENTQSSKLTDSTNKVENGQLGRNLVSIHTQKTETLQYMLSKDGTDMYSTEFADENVAEDQDDDFPAENICPDKTERTSQQQNVPRDTPVDIQVNVLTDSSNPVKIGSPTSDKSADTNIDVILDQNNDGFLRERQLRYRLDKSPILKVAIPDIEDNRKDYLECHFTEAGNIKRDVSDGSKEILDFFQRIDSNSGEKHVSNGKTKNENKSYSNGDGKTICTAVDSNEEKQVSERNFSHTRIRHSHVLSENELSTILDNSCNRSKNTHTFSSQTASNAVLEYFDMQSVQNREVSKSNFSKEQSNSYSYIEVPTQRQLHNEVENYIENESAEKGYPKPAVEGAALNSHSSREDLFQGTLQDNSNEHYQSEIMLTEHKDLIDTNYEDSNGINITSRTDKIIAESSCNQERNTNQTFVNSQEIDDKGSYSIQCLYFFRDDTDIHVTKEIETRNICDKLPFPNIEPEISKQNSKSEVCKSNINVSTHDVRVGVMEETSLNEPRRIPIAITESHNNEVQLLASEISKKNIGEKVDKPERKLDYYSPDQGMDTKDGKSIVDDSEKITDEAEGCLPAKFKEVLAQNKMWQSENMNVTGNEQIDGEVTQNNANGIGIRPNRNDERKNVYDHAFAISNCERQEVRSGSKDVFKYDDCAAIKLNVEMENVSNTKAEGVQSSQNEKHEESPMSNECTVSAEVQHDTNDELSVLDIAAAKYICSDNDSVGSKFKSGKLLEVHNSTVQQKFQSDIEIDYTQNSAILNMTSPSRPENKDGRESVEDTEVTADEMHTNFHKIMITVNESKGDTRRDTFSEKELFDTADTKRRNIDDENPYEIYEEMEQYESPSSNVIYVHSFCASSTGQNSSVVFTDAYIAREYKQKPSTEELAEATKRVIYPDSSKIYDTKTTNSTITKFPFYSGDDEAQYQKQNYLQKAEQTRCELKSGAQGKAMAYEGQEHNFSPEIVEINDLEKDDKIFAEESRDGIPILAEGDRDKMLNQFRKNDDSIKIYETVGEWSLGIDDKMLSFKSAIKYIFPELENITSEHGYITLADGITKGIQLSEKVEIDDDIQFPEQHNHKGIDEATTVLQPDIDNTAFIFETIDEAVSPKAENADGLRQEKTKVTDKMINETYLLVQDVNDATRIENTTEVDSLNLNKLTDEQQFSVHVYAKGVESTKQDASNEVEIIDSSPQKALATTDGEINRVHVLAKNEMDKRKLIHVLQDHAKNINIAMSELPIGRQDGVSNVEIIKQIASSEFANMNGLEKRDKTLLDDNSKQIDFSVENGISTNEIQSPLEFGVNKTNVKLQIGIKDSTTTFKAAKQINSLEAEKIHDVTHEITNISDPTAVNFHLFVTNDNHESTIQHTTHTVFQSNDKNKDVLQIHMEDRASAREGSRQDFAPETEQTEDADKVDTTVVEGIGKEIKASTKSDSKNNCIQYMSPDDFQTQDELQLCTNNSIYSIKSTNTYASPKIKTSATSEDDDRGMKNISTDETRFVSPADSKKNESLYMAQDEYTSTDKTTPDVELNTKSISSKVVAANQDFTPEVNNILFMKKDGTKLIEGVGDEIQLSKSDNKETFIQIKTQGDSQDMCETADKATKHVVRVMTENIDPSEQDEVTKTDELPKESQLSVLDNNDESKTQSMTMNDFKSIDKATDELHLGIQNGPQNFETTEEDVSTKEENNTSEQGNASVVDGNTGEVWILGTDNCDENGTRFLIEYYFKNIDKDEMQLDVRGSANTVKKKKHDVCPEENFEVNVFNIKQDEPLGLQADAERVIKTEVDISLEKIDSAKTVESLIHGQGLKKDQEGNSGEHSFERSFLLSHNDTYSGLEIQEVNQTDLSKIGDDMKGLESTAPEATEKELESDTEKKVIISATEETVCNSDKTQALNSNPDEENDSLHETAREDFSKNTSDDLNEKGLETTDLIANLEIVSFYQISKDTHPVIQTDSQYVHETTQVSCFNDKMDSTLHTSELFETDVIKAVSNSCEHFYPTTDAGFNGVHEEDKYFSLLSANEGNNRNCKDDHPKMEWSKQTRKTSMQEKARDKQYRNTETKTESADYYMNTDVSLEQPTETYKNKLKITGHISTDYGTTKTYILQSVEETGKEQHKKDFSVEFEELSQSEQKNTTNLDDNVAGCNRIVRKFLSIDESNVNADTAKIDDASEDVLLQDKKKYPNENRKVNKSQLNNSSESIDNENGLQAINNSKPDYEKSSDETDNKGADVKACFTISISGYNIAGDGEQMIATNEKTKTVDENDENNQYTVVVGNGTEILTETKYIYSRETEENDIHHEVQNNVSSYAEVSNLRIKNETNIDDRSMIESRLLALQKSECIQMMPKKIYITTDNDSKTPSDSTSIIKDVSLNTEFTMKTNRESLIKECAIQITSSTSDDDNCQAPADLHYTKTTVEELQLTAQTEELCPNSKYVANVSAKNGISNYDEGKQSDRCLNEVNTNVENLKLPPNPRTKNGNYGCITTSADPGLITISLNSIVTDYLKESDEIIKGSKTRFEKLNKDEHEAAEGRDSTQDKKYAIENSDELNKNKTDEGSKESENQVNITLYTLYSGTCGKNIPENSAKIFDGKSKEETEHFDVSRKPVRDDLQTQAEKENLSYLIETKAIVTASPDNREDVKYAAVTVKQSSTETAQDSWSLVQPETIGTNKRMEKANYEDIDDAKNIGDTKDKNAIRNEKIKLCPRHDFETSDPNDQESERKEQDNTKYVESDTANQSPNTAAADGTTTVHETFIKAITHNENNRQTGNEMETPSHSIQKDSVVEEDEYVYVTKMCNPSTFEDNTGQADETLQVHTVTSDDEINSSNRSSIGQKTVNVSCNSAKATKELDSPDEQIQVKDTVAKNKEKSTTDENKSAADEETNTLQTFHEAYYEMFHEATDARDFGSQNYGIDPIINEPMGQKISAERSQFDQVATKELCMTSEHGITNVSNVTKQPSQVTHHKDYDQTQNWDTSRQYVCKSLDAEKDDNVDVEKYIDKHFQASIHTTLEHDETNKDISLSMQEKIQKVKEKPGYVKFFKPGIVKEKVDTGERTLEDTSSIIPNNFYYKLTRRPSSVQQYSEINANLVGESINLKTLNSSQYVEENAEGRDDKYGKIFALEPYLVTHADGQAANDRTYECRFTIHTAIRSVYETGLNSIHAARNKNEDLNVANLYLNSSTHDETNTPSSISGEFYLTEEDEMIVEISEGTTVKIENTANAEENINLYVPSYVPNKEKVSYETSHIKRSTKSIAKDNREAAQVDDEINSIYKDEKKISDKETHQSNLYVKRKRVDITETAIITLFSNNIDVTTNDKLFKDVSYEVNNDPTFKQYRNVHGITMDKLAQKKDEVIMTSRNTTETMSKAPARWNTFQEISDGNYQILVEINSQNVDEATTQRLQDQMQIETAHDIHNCKGFGGSSQTATTSAEQIWKELDIRNENGDTMYKKALDTYYTKTQFATEMTTTPRTTQGDRRQHLIDETIKSASHYKNESQYSSAAFFHSVKNHHVYNANSNATAVEIPIAELGKHDSVKPELNEPCVSNDLRIYESQLANNVEIDNTLSLSKQQDINADVPLAIVDKELLFNTEKPIHDISYQNNIIDYDSSSQSKSKHSVNNTCQSAKPHEEIKSLNITRYAELESGEIFDPSVNVSLYVNGDLSYKTPHEDDIERQPTTQIILDTTKLIKGVQSTESKTKEANQEHAQYVNHMENRGQGARDNCYLGDRRVRDTNVLSHDLSLTKCKGACDYSGECERTLLSLETSTLTEHPHIASESESIVHNMTTNVSEMKSKPSMNITAPYIEESETVETKEAKYFPYLSAVSRIVESSLLDIRTNDSLKRLIVKTSDEIQYESVHNLPETTGPDYPQNVGVHGMSVERDYSIVSNESLATNEVIRSKYLISKRYTQTPNDADNESEIQPKEYKSDLAVEGDIQISEEGLDKFSIDSNNSINDNEIHKNETNFRSTQGNVNEKERKMSETESHIQQLSENTDKARKSTDCIGMKMMDGNARFVAATFSKPSIKIQGNQSQQTSENMEDIDLEDPWTNRETKDVNEETNDANRMLLNHDIDYRKTHKKYADPERRYIKPKEEPINEQEQLIYVYHETEEGNIPEDNIVREIGKDYIREVTLHPLENGKPNILQDNDKSENDDKIEKSNDDSKKEILQNCTSTSKEIPISKIKNDEPSKSLPTKLLSLVKDLKKTLTEETEMQLQYMSCLRSARENIKRGLEVFKPIRCDDERSSREYDSESEYSTDTYVIYHEDDCSHSINQDEHSIGFEKSPDNDKFDLSRNRDKTVDEKDNQTEVKRFGVASDSEVLECGRKVKKNIPTRYKEEAERDVDKLMETNEDKEEEHVREKQEFSDIIAYRDENEKLNKTKSCEKKSTEGTVLTSGNKGTVSEKDTKTPFGSGMRKDTDAYMPKYHAPKRNPKIDSKWPSSHPAYQMLYRKQLSPRKLNIGALPHLKKNNINDRGQPPSPIKAVDPIHRCGAAFLPPIHHPTHPDTTDDIPKAKQYLEYLHNHPIPSKSKKTKGPLGNRRKEGISMSLPNLSGTSPLSPPQPQIHQEMLFESQPPTSPKKPFSAKELAEMEEYLELIQRKPYSPGKSFSSKQADLSHTFSIEDLVEIIQVRKTFYLGNRKEMDDYRKHRIHQIFRELQEIRKKTEEGKDILIIRKGVRPRSGRKDSENSKYITFDYSLGEVEKMKTDEDLRQFLCDPLQNEMSAKRKPLCRNKRRQQAYSELKDKLNQKYSQRYDRFY